MSRDRRTSAVGPDARRAAEQGPSRGATLWPARLAVVAAVGLYRVLPERLTLGTALKWAVTLVEVAHVLPLSVAAQRMRPGIARWPRPLALALIVVVNLVNVLSLVLLIDALLHGRTNLGHAHLDGRTLILAAIEIWLTNVLVFALRYWELGHGGPGTRRCSEQRVPDFLVPQ